MPAWWKVRSKPKSKGNPNSLPALDPSPTKKPDCEEDVRANEGESSLIPKHMREARKERAHSFDGVLPRRQAEEIRNVSALGHPLPLPSPSSPPPSQPLLDSGTAAASGSAWVLASSVSSSGSSDDAPNLDFCRFSDPMNMPTGRQVLPDSQTNQYVAQERHPVLEHPRSSDSPVSPQKETTGVIYPETIFNPRTVSSPSSRGTFLSSSPRICPGSPTGTQDGMKSPPHPLPLPPSSPGSPSSFSSRSSQSLWKKGKLLGRGSFGHVYLGFNSVNGQMCAIKEVTVISDDSNSKESLKQLNQEINLLSQLSHSNIVQYYGSDLIDDTLSVYLEYVSGGSIHKLLQEYGLFGEPVIRNYTAQILSGLAYLHGRNTVHRDIKGANILVGPNGEVKLADFGMAKHTSPYASIRSFKGSPYWMAPEVIMNGSGYNLSVDIWSLGCTILEMATSKPPWSQYEGVAAIFKIGNSRDLPDTPDHLSSEAKSFVRLCLQRDPLARPTASQLMDHPFVSDQDAVKAIKSSMMRDMLPSSLDRSYSMVIKKLRSNRSISPLRDKDYGLGRRVTDPLAHKIQSDSLGMRLNVSLPVSPCSSPLRQFNQSNRSSFHSPNHPVYSSGALISDQRSCFSSYRMRPSYNFPDLSPDFSELRIRTSYEYSRR